MASIEEVAREAGVSISTVSYALSGKRAISESTRSRVQEAAQRMGYQPKASARMLASKHSQIIAVTAPIHDDTDREAHMSFALEVTRAARTHDYDTLLLVHDDAIEGIRRTAATSLADGIIVLDVDANDERVTLARTIACPTVFVGVPSDTTGLICVDLDFETAAEMAIDRLIEAGRRSIALISHSREVIERQQNFPLRFSKRFCEYAAERGVEFAVIHPSADSTSAEISALLERLPSLDGLIVNAGPEVAWRVVPVLESLDRTVPEDISIIAAGVPYSVDRFPIPFDTIPLDATASCELAVQMLVDQIEKRRAPQEVTLIPPSYVERGSVRRRPPAQEGG